MRIYFSGIGGVGIGPLAALAYDAGYDVIGSDPEKSLQTDELAKKSIPISDDQSGDYLRYSHGRQKIDWFVYTAALPDDHPELVAARQLGIHTSKRDELLRFILNEKNLKMITISGTHGKTTTTGMMIWTMRQLGVPISYSIGTTLSFAPNGRYEEGSQYFIYECDEFDRNFLQFAPYLSLVTSVDYDHPDTYPTERDYVDAFSKFLSQSEMSILWQKDTKTGMVAPRSSWVLRDKEIMPLKIAGAHNRANATLIAKACERLKIGKFDMVKLALESFPGTARRFEKLADGLYSDYGHHPVEIAATLQMARELSDQVTLVYQPHQNVRQHEIVNQYTDDVFANATDIYWLPTYLTREDPNLPVLTPQELTTAINPEKLHYADLNDDLWQSIKMERELGKLVLLMGAGTIDGWVRDQLAR